MMTYRSGSTEWHETLQEALKEHGIHHLWPAFLTVRRGEETGVQVEGLFMVVERNVDGLYRVMTVKKMK